MVLKAYEYQDLIVYFVVFVYLSLFWIPIVIFDNH